jgi:hypothetical protein
MKRFLLLFVAAIVSISAFAQATKPTIIVLPSDIWACANNYTTSNGCPDYDAAFRGDAMLRSIADMVGDEMRAGGLNVIDFDAYRKIAEYAERSGVVFYEKPYDFIIYVSWEIINDNDCNTLNLSMNALDVYSNKYVASVMSKVTKVKLSEADIRIAAMSEMDSLVVQFRDYLEDIMINGREMRLDVIVLSASSVTLEQEYDGYALMDYIEAWVDDCTVNGMYNVTNISHDCISFSAMVPCYLDSGVLQSPTTFAQQLSDYLSEAPFSLKTKVQTNGRLLLL